MVRLFFFVQKTPELLFNSNSGVFRCITLALCVLFSLLWVFGSINLHSSRFLYFLGFQEVTDFRQ